MLAHHEILDPFDETGGTMNRTVIFVVVLLAWLDSRGAIAGDASASIKPLMQTVDLNVGESAEVKLADSSTARVKVIGLEEFRDNVRQAVRSARVDVEVNGRMVRLMSANYNLPVRAGDVQIDCPITRGCVQENQNPWALDADVRLRLWPGDSPWISPDTFSYPVKQRWFASDTQMSNEPTFVDGGEDPARKSIYYHWGLDFGGAEGLVEVVAATDGVVCSAGTESLKDLDKDTPVRPRYDVVYVRDDRGWYYRYSHLHTIRETVKPGATVRRGQTIGLLGKEGGSGGWAHLHFDISAIQPSGRFGIVEAYAFAWQAYLAEYPTTLKAIARPHHLAWVGETITLDATRSFGANIVRYDWTLCDGTTASGPRIDRRYDRPGEYSEVLKITDTNGQIDYDFARVLVIDRAHPDQLPPAIHPVYYPTFDIGPGDPVTFKVRSFQIKADEGKETWDFGDGSPVVQTQSDGNAKVHDPNGYAVTTHRFEQPGHYVVRVQRTNDRQISAIGHVHVRVTAGERR
ncbi:MAG: hypothetical protein FJ276_27620 [Planctomycetes bacterium]|nr:hypothetical protein [Planctomycetota bacterium]